MQNRIFCMASAWQTARRPGGLLSGALTTAKPRSVAAAASALQGCSTPVIEHLNRSESGATSHIASSVALDCPPHGSYRASRSAGHRRLHPRRNDRQQRPSRVPQAAIGEATRRTRAGPSQKSLPLPRRAPTHPDEPRCRRGRRTPPRFTTPFRFSSRRRGRRRSNSRFACPRPDDIVRRSISGDLRNG